MFHTHETVLAHLGNGAPQSLQDHLSAVGEQTALHASKLGLAKAGELIGLLHDLGKSTATFQHYLSSFSGTGDAEPQDKLRGRIDHSTAGAQCLLVGIPGAVLESGMAGFIVRWLGLCIASHHSGLIDCLSPDGGDTLNVRLRKPDSETWYTEAWRTLSLDIRDRALALMASSELLAECNRVAFAVLRGEQTRGDRPVQFGLLTRMLLSCLIDADRTNTADHERPAAAPHRQISRYESWQILLARLSAKLALLPAEGEINTIRAAISKECSAASQRPRGIYTLTVPTGGGKTLAALRFAMEHARHHKLDRVIFVSPYVSIVDQNAAVARSFLEPPEAAFASVVLEHHSDLAVDRDPEKHSESWRSRVLAENWDAPVVFTTMVQVLEALFGSGTGSLRRLHALGRAVLVFDEVQTLPVRLVHLFNNAINLLTVHCGSTVLLCTATQPLLHEVDEKLGAACLAPEPDLVADVRGLFQRLRRNTVVDSSGRSGGWTREHVAELACKEAGAAGSGLVVVNTKRDALEIFNVCRERVREDALVLHLSTGMCPAHRTRVLHRLKSRLADVHATQPLICVSTQLIEAGVDIDFETVVRDLASLDSLAQAAGRCNRHGKRPQPGRVHIVKLPDPPKQLADILKGREVADEILGRWRREHPGESFPLDDPHQMESFYATAFFRRKHEMSYHVKLPGRGATLLDLLGNNRSLAEELKRQRKPVDRQYLRQSFKTANEAFILIEPTQGVVVPYGTSGKKVSDDLSAAHDLEAEWQVRRAAQSYTLSVQPSIFTRLLDMDAVYEVSKGAGVYCLRSEFYDAE